LELSSSRLTVLLLALLCACLGFLDARAADDTILIEAFVREGCPHCAKAEGFLARLGQERTDLKIVIRDVQKEPAALARLQEVAKALHPSASDLCLSALPTVSLSAT